MTMDEHTDKEYVGGFVPVMTSQGDVTLREGGAIALFAKGGADIKEGGAGFCVIGGSASINQGGAGNMIVAGSAEMSEAMVGQMATMRAEITNSKVGMLLAGSATLEQSEVAVTTQQAAVFGVVAGVVCFLLTKLFGR
jgi:hypothetical protein